MLVTVMLSCNNSSEHNAAKNDATKEISAPATGDIVLRANTGYYDPATTSMINLGTNMGLTHDAKIDSGYFLFAVRTIANVGDYYMAMNLCGLQPNNGKLDVTVYYWLNLASAEPSCMFIAKCANARMDTIVVKPTENHFTIHLTDAKTANYSITLFGLHNPVAAATVALKDVVVSAPR